MGKKEKIASALEEDFKAISVAVPKLEKCLKAYREIAAAYQKFRKNGGAAIAGIEKYVGASETPKKTEKTATAAKATEPKKVEVPEDGAESAPVKKPKKKVKK